MPLLEPSTIFCVLVTAVLDTVSTVVPFGVIVNASGATVSCVVLSVFTTRLPALADEPLPAPPVCSVSTPPDAPDALPRPVPDERVKPAPAANPDVPSALPISPTVIDSLNVAAFATVTDASATVITVVPFGASTSAAPDVWS